MALVQIKCPNCDIKDESQNYTKGESLYAVM